MASAPHPWATKIAGNLRDDADWTRHLRRDPAWRHFDEIPSLSRRLRSYRAADFREIAKHVQSGAIEVETMQDSSASVARYVWKGNLLILNRAYAVDPDQIRSHIFHEAAHAIQDDRRMYLSKPEAEQDAHFVHAVYCIMTAREDEVADYAVKGKGLARRFLANGPPVLRSEEFASLQKEFNDDILSHYVNVDETHTGDYDVKTTALQRERRLRDGIRG